MKAKVMSYVFLSAILSLNLAAFSAQGKGKPKQEARVRSMFVEKKIDGLEVKLTDPEGRLIDPGKAFKAGDKVRIRFFSNFGGHVYFINVTPGGSTKVIHQETVQADQDYLLPSRGFTPFTFDNEVGTEVLRVVLSQERIKTYEEAIEKAKGELGKSADSVAAELAENSGKTGAKKNNDKPGEAVNIVTSNDTCARQRGLVLASGKEARCRGLVLASGNKAKDEGAIVAISDKQGGKMNAGEIAVFELRLKHI